MKTIRIYRVLFEDGSGYVGQTRQPTYRSRLGQHRRTGTPLGLKLASGMPYTVDVLAHCRTQAEANAIEQRFIDDLAQPLNRVPAPRLDRDPVLDREVLREVERQALQSVVVRRVKQTLSVTGDEVRASIAALERDGVVRSLPFDGQRYITL